jgi:hypothetical protein
MRHENEPFTETPTAIAQAAGCTPDLIRHYCNTGLLDFIKLANGMRLLQKRAGPQASKIKAQRMALRGRG